MGRTLRVMIFGAVLASSLFAESPFASFPKGSGSKFELQWTDVTATVLLYVTESTDKRLGVETYLTAKSLLGPVEVWQQFLFSPKPGGGVSVTDGFVYGKELKTPERLEPAQLNGMDGLSLEGFLFSSPDALQQFKVGEETITVPAGTVKATHYRQSQGKDTFDYWISDEARPLGLVQLKATSSDPGHNYSLKLGSLLKNVAPKIDPAKAIPLDDKGRDMMALPKEKGTPLLVLP